MDIQALVSAQRTFFQTGAILPLAARRAALEKLFRAIQNHERDIAAALAADLNKSPAESYMCEIGITLSELRYIRRHLGRWARDRQVPTPLSQFPARSCGKKSRMCSLTYWYCADSHRLRWLEKCAAD